MQLVNSEYDLTYVLYVFYIYLYIKSLIITTSPEVFVKNERILQGPTVKQIRRHCFFRPVNRVSNVTEETLWKELIKIYWKQKKCTYIIFGVFTSVVDLDPRILTPQKCPYNNSIILIIKYCPNYSFGKNIFLSLI